MYPTKMNLFIHEYIIALSPTVVIYQTHFYASYSVQWHHSYDVWEMGGAYGC